MIEPQIDSILEQYGTDWTVVTRLHDVPPYEVYEVRVDGRRAVLKVDAHERGHAEREGHVQAFVASETELPAPAVHAIGEDHFLAAWNDSVPPEGSGPDETWARTAGTTLARLHKSTADRFEMYGRPDSADDGLTVDGRAAWIDAAQQRLRYHRSFLRQFGHADVVDRVWDLFDRTPDLFEGAGEPVLCHGNGHPDHLAVADGSARALIDFEHALVAPGEYDYWRVALPVFDGSDGDTGPCERAFRNGYESVRSLPAGFERRSDAYRLLNGVSYLESLHLQQNVPAGERGERATAFRERILATVDQVADR